MRAFISGGAGFIGSHLAERLVADGWEVCRLMKQHPSHGRGVRVIMVTALDQWDDKRQALQTGADDYVTKPIDLPRLVRTVERNAAALQGAA